MCRRALLAVGCRGSPPSSSAAWLPLPPASGASRPRQHLVVGQRGGHLEAVEVGWRKGGRGRGSQRVCCESTLRQLRSAAGAGPRWGRLNWSEWQRVCERPAAGRARPAPAHQRARAQTRPGRRPSRRSGGCREGKEDAKTEARWVLAAAQTNTREGTRLGIAAAPPRQPHHHSAPSGPSAPLPTCNRRTRPCGAHTEPPAPAAGTAAVPGRKRSRATV